MNAHRARGLGWESAKARAREYAKRARVREPSSRKRPSPKADLVALGLLAAILIARGSKDAYIP